MKNLFSILFILFSFWSYSQVPLTDFYRLGTDLYLLEYDLEKGELKKDKKKIIGRRDNQFSIERVIKINDSTFNYVVKFCDFHTPKYQKRINNLQIKEGKKKRIKKKDKIKRKITLLKKQQNKLDAEQNKFLGSKNNGSYFIIESKYFQKPYILKSKYSKYRVNGKGLFSEEDSSKTRISFVGAGDIQKSISEGSEIAANTGVGVILYRQWENSKWFTDMELDFSINVASTVDTIKGVTASNTLSNSREYGSYLLLPMNSGQATKLSMNTYFTKDKINISPFKNDFYLTNLINGFNVNFIASNRIWSTDSSSRNATGMSLKIGVFHEFIPNRIRQDSDKRYSIKAGISYSFRGLYGDAGFLNENGDNFRIQTLGNSKTQYHGIEIDLSFRLKNIEARVSIPTLNTKGNNVPGLTNTQFITSISFVGGFPLSIK